MISRPEVKGTRLIFATLQLIVLLAGLLWPVLAKVREAGSSTERLNNLLRIGITPQLYPLILEGSK